MVSYGNGFSFSSQYDGRVLWDTAGFQFLAVSLTNGIVLAEFPDLQVSRLSYRFEETTSETVVLPWRNVPSNWVEVTIPYRTAILLVRGRRYCGVASWSNANVVSEARECPSRWPLSNIIWIPCMLAIIRIRIVTSVRS